MAKLDSRDHEFVKWFMMHYGVLEIKETMSDNYASVDSYYRDYRDYVTHQNEQFVQLKMPLSQFMNVVKNCRRHDIRHMLPPEREAYEEFRTMSLMCQNG